MEYLTEIISRATASVEQNYFKLSIDGGASIYRERVYCYELYHQMRKIWPTGIKYTLNGEVDKKGHSILKKLDASNTVPDFLIHTPGNMSGNHCIIEVKSQNPTKAAVIADLKKIEKFQTTVEYERGIYLIYGRSADQDVMRILKFAGEEGIEKVPEIWIHREPGCPAYRHP